jgi:hypothetical protein
VGVSTGAELTPAADDTQSSAPALTLHLLSGRASVSTQYACELPSQTTKEAHRRHRRNACHLEAGAAIELRSSAEQLVAALRALRVQPDRSTDRSTGLQRRFYGRFHAVRERRARIAVRLGRLRGAVVVTTRPHHRFVHHGSCGHHPRLFGGGLLVRGAELAEA